MLQWNRVLLACLFYRITRRNSIFITILFMLFTKEWRILIKTNVRVRLTEQSIDGWRPLMYGEQRMASVYALDYVEKLNWKLGWEICKEFNRLLTGAIALVLDHVKQSWPMDDLFDGVLSWNQKIWSSKLHPISYFAGWYDAGDGWLKWEKSNLIFASRMRKNSSTVEHVELVAVDDGMKALVVEDHLAQVVGGH